MSINFFVLKLKVKGNGKHKFLRGGLWIFSIMFQKTTRIRVFLKRSPLNVSISPIEAAEQSQIATSNSDNIKKDKIN